MILTFHVPPLARGQGLFNIDSFQSRKIQKRIKKVLARRNSTVYNTNGQLRNFALILPCQARSIF